MRIEYYTETDTLYIELRPGPGVDAREVAPDVVLDLGKDREVIGIEIEHASTRTDLRNVELSALPIGRAA